MFSKSGKKTGLTVLGLSLLLLFSACNQAPVPREHEADFILNNAQSLAQENAVDLAESGILDELTLANGNIVRFIKERAGAAAQIGVVEIVQPGATSMVSSLSTAAELSPLELYQALLPDKVAPSELWANHRALAELNIGIPLEPRSISTATLSTQAVEVKLCSGWTAGQFHLMFQSWVTTAFGAALPNHGHGQNLLSTHYGVTGVSSKRALGTCNVAGYVKKVNIAYKATSNLWINVPIGVTWLFPGQSLFYYSNSGFLVPTKYRIKVGYTVNGLAGNYAHTEGSW